MLNRIYLPTQLLNYTYFILIFYSLCRQEAKGCPRVVVADIDTNDFLKQQTVKIKEVLNLMKMKTR